MKAISQFVVKVADLLEAEGRAFGAVLRAEAHRALGERGPAIQSYRRYLDLMPNGAPDRGEIERALLDLGAAN